MRHNESMRLMSQILAMMCIMAGLIQSFFGNSVAIATFWVAAAGFHIASAIYSSSIKEVS